jgi:hypothetical protein
MTVLIVLIIFLMILLGAAAFAYVYLRGIWREQKNYERGLKMVPVLIHLPPLSDDTDAGGRDARDVVNENISRAQSLYGILSSTFQKGFKHRLYGQRHVGLEIVAKNGAIHYYAAVPVPLLGVVEQAIVSAYPTARLEEVAEHNIFSQVGRITGTVGGELALKESYAYPIATYEDIKRDTMQPLLNALSSLTKEDGAGIQILLRPADPAWRKTANAEADRKRGKKKSGKGIDNTLGFMGDIFTAIVKPPEQSEKKDDPKELTGLDQAAIQAIEDKTKQTGFEVLIRVIASSNISHRAQTILNTLVATFSLYDAPGKNGFKFVPARDLDSFITGYILRFFPQDKTKNILNATELATLFHFPDQSNIPTSQLERQASKQVDGPRNVPEDGLLLGYNLFRGAKKEIRLDDNDRRRHMYLVGQTGTGKSTFLENLALQDMLEGKGFAFVDPHGDTAEKLLAMVPKERTEDVIYFSPGDTDFPLGLNMFEYHSEDQKDFLIQEAINMLYKLYDPTRQGIIGPRYEHLFRNAALAIMADPAGGTFIDIPKLFRDPQYVEQKLKYVTDQNVLEFWRKEMPASQRSNEFGEVTSWFVSKFGAFLSNEMMRNIIGQTKSSFNLREIMDNKKILLVNLSRGRVGDLNSKLLGMIFVMKFEAAAMSRADMDESEREDFCLYVDEFQNFSTDSFADILSQARKYRLNLIVANQFTTQLSEEIRDAVFGNVGSVIAFRVGTTDAEFLAKQFAPVFDIDDLQFLPNYNTAVRMMIGGVPVQPFSMAILPPLGNPNPQLADALKQLSAAKYGRPKAQVEADIFKRLETKQLPKPSSPFDSLPSGRPSFGASSLPPSSAFGPSAGPSPNPTPAKPASSGSSFLDEWLAKRKGNIVGPTTPPAPQSKPSQKPIEPPKQHNHKPQKSKPEQPKEPKLQATPGNAGEFRIDRGDGLQHGHVVHIDRDGNLSFSEHEE